MLLLLIRLRFENETGNRLKMEIEKTMRVKQNFKGEELCNDVIHEFDDRERERERINRFKKPPFFV